MYDRVLINAVWNGELVVVDYPVDYSERFGYSWNLLLNAVKLMAHFSRFRFPEDIKSEYSLYNMRRSRNESELMENFENAECSIFVDLTAKVIYESDKILSEEELDKRPVSDLPEILSAQRKSLHEDFFRHLGKIPFEMLDLPGYLRSQEKSRISDMFALIRWDEFVSLYDSTDFFRQYGAKKRACLMTGKTINRFCAKNDEGALKLKINLCLGSNAVFFRDCDDLEEILKRLADKEYSQKYLLLTKKHSKYPSVLEYADHYFHGKNGYEKNVPLAVSLYVMLYDEYSRRLRDYADRCENTYGRGKKPGNISDLGLFCYFAVLLGDLFSCEENANELAEWYERENGNAYRDDYNNISPWDCPADKSMDKTEFCKFMAYGYYLKARCVCGKYFCYNSVTEKYRSAIEDKMRPIKESLHYAGRDEAGLDNAKEIWGRIGEEVEKYMGTIGISALSGDRYELFIEAMKPGSRIKMRCYPEKSFCSIDSGLRLIADSVKFTAGQNIDGFIAFDRMYYREYEDESGSRRILMSFHWISDVAVEIDAALPLRFGDSSEV